MTDRLREALAAVSLAAAEFAETTTDYDRLLVTIARCGSKLLKSTCGLALLREDGKSIEPVAIHDDDPAIIAQSTDLMRARSIANAAVALVMAGGTVFVPNVNLDEAGTQLAPPTVEFMRRVGVHGSIIVVLRRGQVHGGALVVFRHRSDLPPLDDLDRELASTSASFAGATRFNADLYREAQAEHRGRIAAETALEARAAEATSFLDAIIENIPDMVFVKDADNLEFVRFNRAGETLLGIPRAQLIGKSDFDLFPPEEAKFFVEKDRETLRNKALVDIAEEPIQTRTGERWLHTKKVPIVDANGVPRFLLGISHDITDRKRDLAPALHNAITAAEIANRELEAFSYTVAHDLRAPLRAIDGFSQALIEDCADALGETGRGHLARVRSSAQRMASLIDALLMLSRVTRAELRRQPVDLGDLFRTALSQLQRIEPDRKVEVVVSDTLRAAADPKLVSIVFDNLCGNAWKFSSKAPTARIELGMRLERDTPIYYVRDNGVGFDMAYVQNMFGVFHRLHSDSEFPGTGIGLATVERIIHRHGGRIWAEGQVDQGATFSFTLQPEGTP